MAFPQALKSSIYTQPSARRYVSGPYIPALTTARGRITATLPDPGSRSGSGKGSTAIQSGALLSYLG